MKREKPLLIFDGDCHFCRRWIERWREATGDKVDYRSSDEAAPDHPGIPRADYDLAVQWIGADGRRESAAAAVLSALAEGPWFGRLLLWLYRQCPPFAALAEFLYRLVASNRMLCSRVTRWFWGNDVRRPTYATSTRLFLQALGLVYLIAFASFWLQMPGLIGERGILPATDFFQRAHQVFGPSGFWQFPSLFWWGASEPTLATACLIGLLAALLLTCGILPLPSLAVLWVTYLSLSIAGQEFYQFQWDILLLETGFLALFLAPWTLRLNGRTQPPRLARGLLLWLLFRLMFSAGVVKLSSGDPSWTAGTALDFHYYTQPLPTVLGWYAHQFPGWFQWLSVKAMFFVDLIVPFLLFAPRRPRHLAALLLIAFQILIGLTGNYGFFNLLTITLCLLAFDDTFWRRRATQPPAPLHTGYPLRPVIPIVAAALFLLSLPPFLAPFRQPLGWMTPLIVRYQKIAPFRSVNGYGLFAVMTKQRHEIVVEGSNDGYRWQPYRFRFKPNTAREAPRWAGPYMPRLDWQMWFAALGTAHQNPWFFRFLERLAEGSPEVLALLEENPFPEAPPRYLRAQLDAYTFTTWPQRRTTGDWWQVLPIAAYYPEVTTR